MTTTASSGRTGMLRLERVAGRMLPRVLGSSEHEMA